MSCYSTGNIGGQYCIKGNKFGDPTGIILAVDGFSLSAANFLLQESWNTAINARNVFPIMDLVGFTDNSTEANYIDFPNERRKLTRQGKYRMTIEYDLNETQKKQLLNFRGFNGKIFLVYENNIIRGRSVDAGITVQGARVDLFNVHKEKLNTTGEAAIIMIDIDLSSEKDFNEYDYAMEMGWDVTELDGLTEVDLAVVGTPTATSVVVSVSSSVYGTSNPITGLVLGDFDIALTGTATTATDNGDGTYTIGGTLFVTGTVNLKAPSLMATTDLLIISSGAAAVTI